MGLRLTNRKVLARNPVVGRAAAIPGHPPASGSAFLSEGHGDNLEVRAADLQGGNLQEILSIFGTEHLNLNTYYARPMADLFDTHSDGKWDFKAVASTLLKLTTLFDPNTNINYTAGPNLKQLTTCSIGRRKPATSTSREKTACQPSSTTRSSGKA